MLLSNLSEIGNRLLFYRKKAGLTQTELAEAASLSDRAYADIERGLVNMRVETLLRICQVLELTPNDLLVSADPDEPSWEELNRRLEHCPEKNRRTVYRLMSVYLQSLNEP